MGKRTPSDQAHIRLPELMDRETKLLLIQRTLGIKHKLKVHESMRTSDTHDDLSVMILARWELEDEMRAIDEVLTEERSRAIATKKLAITEGHDLGKAAKRKK